MKIQSRFYLHQTHFRPVVRVLALAAALISGSAVAEPLATNEGANGTACRFTSLESIAAVVPPSTNFHAGPGWNVAAIQQAGAAIDAQTHDQPATLRFKVKDLESCKNGNFVYRLNAPDGEVNVRGTFVRCRMAAYFKEDQADALARVHPGTTVLLSGVLSHSSLVIQQGKPGLIIDLHDATLETR